MVWHKSYCRDESCSGSGKMFSGKHFWKLAKFYCGNVVCHRSARRWHQLSRHWHVDKIQQPVAAKRQYSQLGCFQYGRFVVTWGPCMNFTTFRTSRKSSQRWSERSFQGWSGISKKHFPFTHTKEDVGKMMIWHLRKKHFPFTKKMWEILLRLNGPTFAVLSWFWCPHSKNTQLTALLLGLWSAFAARVWDISVLYSLRLCRICVRDSPGGLRKIVERLRVRPQYLRNNCAKVVFAQFWRKCFFTSFVHFSWILRFLTKKQAVRAINVSKLERPPKTPPHLTHLPKCHCLCVVFPYIPVGNKPLKKRTPPY